MVQEKCIITIIIEYKWKNTSLTLQPNSDEIKRQPCSIQGNRLPLNKYYKL